MKMSQVKVENAGIFAENLKKKYEEATGKKVGDVANYDMTDFISFYGGSIEYVNFNNNIKSVVVQIEESNSFKILITNKLNPIILKKEWEEGYLSLLSNKKLPSSTLKELRKMYENSNYSITELNMEVIKAFYCYLIAKEKKQLSYGDVVITTYESLLPKPSEEEIIKTKELVKKLVFTKNGEK